ncbi:sulfatase-like hydrolase/transferase [Thiovibrio frasassiensis]|uniref:Sulfatase-like hydrolase/transferase n=1 Tax=Thiovibrio frasassiensis TaxID=2984131 RepID=A0A9X4MEF8_9BACT|nr:sulfatase-like hydrolase/transferase [Thiovibrio frasassiensis]MDG4476069.1 sulfatase-like hydrolase/transferase [Thiovibrio frasassiensis]
MLTNRYTAFLLLLLGYTEMSQQYGGLPSLLPAWRLEIPLLLYLYFLLNQFLRKSRWQPLVAAAPILLMYAVFDAYHIMFGRMLRITEITELPEMFQVLPPLPLTLIALLIGLPLLAFLAAFEFRPRRTIMASLPLLALLLMVEITPDFFMNAFQTTQQEVILYSDTASARNNGRLSMMLYNEAKRKSFHEKIAGHQMNSASLEDFDKVIAGLKGQRRKGNIHLIVLESFLDPGLLKDANFSSNPTHPAFRKLLGQKGGISISPVFAGGTAQAEFEILCGAPALREFSGIEFDVFTGAKTPCLPQILSQGGYETNATNSYKPDFFNSTNAYTGIGFEKRYYPQEFAAGYDTYFSTGDVTGEDYMFDGVLFSQNLEFITRRIKTNPTLPIFNYVIGMYGHSPHDLNLDKRPMVIKMCGKFRDEGLEKAANQYYYRTEAIAAYVKGLIAVDPHSLIILVSDHLPSLSGSQTYKDLNYLGGTEDATFLNRIFIIENGRPVRQNTIHHFDIPRIVLNYASKGKYCQKHDCDFTTHDTPFAKTAYRDDYLDIMSQAMDAASAIRVLGAKTQCVQ